MRIVDLPAFLELPSGTLFAKYQPCIFEELQIKGDNLGEMDFYCRTIWEVECDSSHERFDKLHESEMCDIETPLDFEAYQRDGMYEKDQLFAVFTKEDAAGLIAALQRDTQ